MAKLQTWKCEQKPAYPPFCSLILCHYAETDRIIEGCLITMLTHSMRGRRMAWFPDRPITQAGVSGVASRSATTASTPILLLYRGRQMDRDIERNTQREKEEGYLLTFVFFDINIGFLPIVILILFQFYHAFLKNVYSYLQSRTVVVMLSLFRLSRSHI